MFFHDHNVTHLSDVFNLLSGPFFLLFHEVMLKKTQWSNESKMSELVIPSKEDIFKSKFKDSEVVRH